MGLEDDHFSLAGINRGCRLRNVAMSNDYPVAASLRLTSEEFPGALNDRLTPPEIFCYAHINHVVAGANVAQGQLSGGLHCATVGAGQNLAHRYLQSAHRLSGLPGTLTALLRKLADPAAITAQPVTFLINIILL